MSARTFLVCLAALSVSAAPPRGTLITQSAIAAEPLTGAIYAVDTQRDSLSVLNPQQDATRQIRVGKAPCALAINSATGRIYVANSGSGSVTVLDGKTNSVLTTIPTGPHPYMLTVNQVTGKVYVTNTFSNVVAVIDGTTNTAMLLKLGSFDNVAVDSHTNRVFLISYEDPNLTILDGATNKVEKVSLGVHLWGMAVNTASGTVYVTQVGSARLWTIDERSRQTRAIPVGSFPCAVAVDETRDRAYVVNYADETVSSINGKTGQPITTIRAGSHPQAIQVDSAENRIYVANVHGNSVTVIDGAHEFATRAAKADQNPFALTVFKGVAYAAALSGAVTTIN